MFFVRTIASTKVATLHQHSCLWSILSTLFSDATLPVPESLFQLSIGHIRRTCNGRGPQWSHRRGRQHLVFYYSFWDNHETVYGPWETAWGSSWLPLLLCSSKFPAARLDVLFTYPLSPAHRGFTNSPSCVIWQFSLHLFYSARASVRLWNVSLERTGQSGWLRILKLKRIQIPCVRNKLLGEPPPLHCCYTFAVFVNYIGPEFGTIQQNRLSGTR